MDQRVLFAIQHTKSSFGFSFSSSISWMLVVVVVFIPTYVGHEKHITTKERCWKEEENGTWNYSLLLSRENDNCMQTITSFIYNTSIWVSK